MQSFPHALYVPFNCVMVAFSFNITHSKKDQYKFGFLKPFPSLPLLIISSGTSLLGLLSTSNIVIPLLTASFLEIKMRKFKDSSLRVKNEFTSDTRSCPSVVIDKICSQILVWNIVLKITWKYQDLEGMNFRLLHEVLDKQLWDWSWTLALLGQQS